MYIYIYVYYIILIGDSNNPIGKSLQTQQNDYNGMIVSFSYQAAQPWTSCWDLSQGLLFHGFKEGVSLAFQGLQAAVSNQLTNQLSSVHDPQRRILLVC